MLRRLAAGALIVTGSLLANLGIVMWWFDREVTEPDRIREMAAAVLQSPEIRDEVAELIVTSTAEQLELDLAQTDTLTTATADALTDPAFADVYADALEQLYLAIFEPAAQGDPDIVLSTAEIGDAVGSSLGSAHPTLVDLLDQVGLPETVPLPITELPDLADLEAALGVAWRVAVGVGGTLLVIAIVLHPRSAVAIRRIGILFALAAGVMAGGVWVITDVAAPQIPIDGFDALATTATSVMLASLTAQAIIQAALAVLVAAAAHLRIWLPRLTAPLRAVTATMVR